MNARSLVRTLASIVLAALTPALAASTASAPASAAGVSPTFIGYRTFHYTCDAGRRVSVAYVKYGQTGPTFAVVNYAGHTYGLAEALSASGSRYASLAGPGVGSGLEWWEAKGEGTLSRFVGPDTRHTAPLLTGCVTRR